MQSCFSFFSARLGWLGFLAWLWLAVVPAPAAEDESLVKAMAGLLDAVHEARFDDVIDQVQGDPQLRQHDWASYLLAMALECQGRDEEALAVYRSMLTGWSYQGESLFTLHGACPELSLPFADFHWDWWRKPSLNRMVALSAMIGGQTWQDLLDLVPEHHSLPPSLSD